MPCKCESFHRIAFLLTCPFILCEETSNAYASLPLQRSQAEEIFEFVFEIFKHIAIILKQPACALQATRPYSHSASHDVRHVKTVKYFCVLLKNFLSFFSSSWLFEFQNNQASFPRKQASCIFQSISHTFIQLHMLSDMCSTNCNETSPRWIAIPTDFQLDLVLEVIFSISINESKASMAFVCIKCNHWKGVYPTLCGYNAHSHHPNSIGTQCCDARNWNSVWWCKNIETPCSDVIILREHAPSYLGNADHNVCEIVFLMQYAWSNILWQSDISFQVMTCMAYNDI